MRAGKPGYNEFENQCQRCKNHDKTKVSSGDFYSSFLFDNIALVRLWPSKARSQDVWIRARYAGGVEAEAQDDLKRHDRPPPCCDATSFCCCPKTNTVRTERHFANDARVHKDPPPNVTPVHCRLATDDSTQSLTTREVRASEIALGGSHWLCWIDGQVWAWRVPGGNCCSWDSSDSQW